jgi:cytochrome c biogenesis protein CcdA
MLSLINCNDILGPDHLAAILPSSIGKSYLVAMETGGAWGLGHGLSAMIIGIAGYLLKGRISAKLKTIERVSAMTESVVGVSLMIIGALGIRENLEPSDISNDDIIDNDQTNVNNKGIISYKALFVNGFLHGFSWDGAPSLAPALAMNSWRSAISFLIAYSIGTMLAMSATAAAVGESTRQLGKAVRSRDLTRNLSIGSSIVAMAVGIYWVWNVLFP